MSVYNTIEEELDYGRMAKQGLHDEKWEDITEVFPSLVSVVGHYWKSREIANEAHGLYSLPELCGVIALMSEGANYETAKSKILEAKVKSQN